MKLAHIYASVKTTSDTVIPGKVLGGKRDRAALRFYIPASKLFASSYDQERSLTIVLVAWSHKQEVQN